MAREPELSIKVKVDPQIDAAKLKTSVERQVKNAKQIPEIEVKPNEEKLRENISTALKDTPVTVTPVIDTAKLSTDLQTEISKIKNLPRVHINVDVNDFSNELNERLKTELKEVNRQLSYYLKNLTSNRNGLAEVSSNLLGGKQISKESTSKSFASEMKSTKKSIDETSDSLKGFDQLLSKTRGLNGYNSTEKLLALFDKAREGILKLYDGVNGGDLSKFKENITFISRDVSNLENVLSTLYERIQSPDVMKALGWNQTDIENNLDTIEKFITNISMLPTQTDLKEDLTGALSGIDTDFFEEFGASATEAAESIGYAREDLQSFIDLCNKTNFEFPSIKEPVVKANYDKKLEKTNQSNASGYFDTEHLDSYVMAYDRAMSTLANWQSKINDYKKEALQLEDKLVIKTNINSGLLKKQASDLKTLLDGIDDSKLSKATIESLKIKADKATIQQDVDNLFSGITATVKLKPASDTITNIKAELESSLKTLDVTINDTKSSNPKKEKKSDGTVKLKGHVTIESSDIDVPKEPVVINGKINIKEKDIQIPDTPIDIKAKITDIEYPDSVNNVPPISSTADNSKSEKIKLVKASTYDASTQAMDRYVQKMGEVGVAQELLIQWTDNLTRDLQEQRDIFKEVAEYADKYIRAVELQNRRQGSKSGSDINGVVGVGQITSASRQIGQLSAASANTKNISLIAEYNALQKSFDTFVASGDRSLNTFTDIASAIGNLQQKISDFKKAQDELNKSTSKVTEKTITNFNTMIKQIDSGMWSLKKRNKTALPEYQDISALSERVHSLQSLLSENVGSDENEIAQKWAANYPDLAGKIKKLSEAYDSLRQSATKAGISISEISNEAVQQNAFVQARTRIANLQNQLHDYLERFPKIEQSKLVEEVNELRDALNNPAAYQQADKLGQKMAELKKHAKELGLETENLLDKFEKLFGQHLSTMIVMAALHKMQDAARQVYQNVVDIDTAMTELRKVTNETDATYVKFMEDAADRAQRVGATISDTITATADFARLGYNLEDASSISDTALIYKNVGDGISDINTASESLISTMQAFNIQAKDSMKIVDEFNEAGNNFAISSAGVGKALQRSGAALAAANNTMEQSIALATTMNRIIQNPETVGTTLKTVAMYLRSTKADVEAAGESTEGMAETTSKLRDSLKALSHGQVDIFDSATKQYKSTTDIIIEMGKAWDKMSDKEQAAALELMGGKRNANAVSALITNYQEIEKVIETVSNASGSAEAENAKYLDSIRGLLTELDSTFQAFSTHVFDSDVPKFFISTATAIVKAADAMVKFTGAFPMGAGILSFITQLGEPKTTGFMIVPSNTPGGDTEQVLRRYFIILSRSMREYLVKPTNMAA